MARLESQGSVGCKLAVLAGVKQCEPHHPSELLGEQVPVSEQ